MPTDTVPPAGPEEIPDALQRLRQLLEQEEAATAEREAAALLAQLPDHRDLLYMHAVALRRQSKIPEALAALAALEEAHPTYPRLYQERGHCHVA